MLISPTDGTTSDDKNSIWGTTLQTIDVGNGLFRIFSFSSVDNYFYLGMNVVYQVALVCLRRVKFAEMINLYPKDVVEERVKDMANSQFSKERILEMKYSKYVNFFVKKIFIISDENLREILKYDFTMKTEYIKNLAYLSEVPVEQKLKIYNTVKDFTEKNTGMKILNKIKQMAADFMKNYVNMFIMVGLYFLWIVVFYSCKNNVLTIWSCIIMLHISVTLPFRFEIKLKIGQFLSIPAIILNILLHYITNLNYDLTSCAGNNNESCPKWTSFYYYNDEYDRFMHLCISMINLKLLSFTLGFAYENPQLLKVQSDDELKKELNYMIRKGDIPTTKIFITKVLQRFYIIIMAVIFYWATASNSMTSVAFLVLVTFY